MCIVCKESDRMFYSLTYLLMYLVIFLLFSLRRGISAFSLQQSVNNLEKLMHSHDLVRSVREKKIYHFLFLLMHCMCVYKAEKMKMIGADHFHSLFFHRIVNRKYKIVCFKNKMITLLYSYNKERKVDKKLTSPLIERAPLLLLLYHAFY